jgi:hypothetical protein
MFGCIGRLVVAVLLLILGAVGWHFRDKWVPKVKAFISAETGVEVTGRPGDLAYHTSVA